MNPASQTAGTGARPPGAPWIGLVLAAAGAGVRMGGGARKQFAVLRGRPVLARALAPFLQLPRLARVVVALPPEDLERGEEVARRAAAGVPVKVVAGGRTRQESVRAALMALSDVDVVLVHDAARPLVSVELAARVAEAACRGECAVPVVPLSDTLKRVDADAVTTVSRAGLYVAQTPQGFPRRRLVEAHARAAIEGVTASDDAALVEAFGSPVRPVPGEATNLKLTTPADHELAEALLAAREAGATVATRTGIGYDVHRLAEGRPCILGGVRIDSPRGPVGHSDGDVLVHAVMDAVLGAAGEPDIGHRFPPEDPRYAGADSLGLLAEVRDAVARSFEVLFVDACLIAEEPRAAPHIPAMRARIAAALGVPPDRVNVKATTAEGLGPIGRGEGIAAQAVATLSARGASGA